MNTCRHTTISGGWSGPYRRPACQTCGQCLDGAWEGWRMLFRTIILKWRWARDGYPVEWRLHRPFVERYWHFRAVLYNRATSLARTVQAAL